LRTAIAQAIAAMAAVSPATSAGETFANTMKKT
jgi:hypothetical protein